MIRTVWSILNIVVSTMIFSAITLGGAVLRVRSLSFYDWTARTWSRWILWGSGSTVRVDGLENIDPDAPQVLAGNHQSWFDVPAIASQLPKSFHFVAKKELESVPLFGRAWKAAGHISIDRTDRESAVRSLEQASRQLRADASAVVIFPEGTRADSDALREFKKGAFMLALHTGVDIVPIAVIGGREVLPKGSWIVTPGTITIRIGSPIRTSDYTLETRDDLMRVTRDALRSLLPGSSLKRPDPTSNREHSASVD